MSTRGDIRAVTLETKCWERDYKRILTSGHLRDLAEFNMYPFAERRLMINNVSSYRKVCKLADEAVKRNWITKYVIVEEHADEALAFFQLDKESLGIGYVYSIAELVGIYLCKSEYLLHFAGDCHLATPCDWIPEAINLMTVDPQLKVANLSWTSALSPPYKEAIEVRKNFYVGYGFSDQIYMIRLSDFRQAIYNERNPDSERFPNYGGELFEKRVDSWMRNRGYLRATFRHGTYKHESALSFRGRIKKAARRMVQMARL